MFRTNLSKSNLEDNRQIEAILPSLLHLLDERDAAAKAVVNLIAEYCSMYVYYSLARFVLLDAIFIPNVMQLLTLTDAQMVGACKKY